MDTVLSHASAHNDNEIAGPGLFLVQLSPVVFAGHNTNSPGKHERFSPVAVVEIHKALRSRDARAVAAGADTADNAVKDPARGEDRVLPFFPAEQRRVVLAGLVGQGDEHPALDVGALVVGGVQHLSAEHVEPGVRRHLRVPVDRPDARGARNRHRSVRL